MGKSPTTHDHLVQGVVDSLRVAGEDLGLSIEQLLENASLLINGTTIGTNALIERTGAKTGLITTLGHEDTLPIGRVFAKRAGLSEREIIHLSRLNKPTPLVPRELIKGVAERIDYSGRVIVDLNEDSVRAAAQELASEGVEAIAICYLWAFVNMAHEQRTKEILADVAPDVFVTTSSEIAPVLGEYERTVTTVLNCYLGPRVRAYMDDLREELAGRGYENPILLMQSGGGVVSTESAQAFPVATLDSGPVGGVQGARFLGEQVQEENIICTDVGGTSFDVGLIRDGELQLETQPVVAQYVYEIPKVLIKSIGAGGGSIAWQDQLGYLHVGPQSSGSHPGPACYGRGGKAPTVTDADLLLGYLDPAYFLGGRMKLRADLAEEALAPLADDVGMDVIELAAGIADITNAQMADLVRQATVEQGYDPRQFVMVAYGGAGPLHACFYGAEVGAKYVLVPRHATVFSAVGMLSAEVKHTAEMSRPMRSPLSAEDFSKVNDIFHALTGRVVDSFASEGHKVEQVSLKRQAFLRYPTQVHELDIDLPLRDLSQDDEGLIAELFHDRYSETYGKDAAFAAGFELLTCRITGSVDAGKPPVEVQDEIPKAGTRPPVAGTRQVFFDGGFTSADVYLGHGLLPGNVLAGPAVVERMGDTVVIPPQTSAAVDNYGNIRIELGAER